MYLPYFHITLTLTGVVNWLLAFVGLQALTPLLVYLIDALVILLGIVMPVVTILIYLLRKFLGFIQRRLGPMRTGPLGVLQTVADGLKLFHKEDIVPAKADRVVFALAPYLVFLPAIMVYVVIPFGRGQGFITKDLNIGLVYITASASPIADAMPRMFQSVAEVS
ncbi:MAG TPA: complex I subunit 1 family protein, partial [Armatimonadota bacterium]|nr:complex I subunit 1 family protein [Armatimonadota bacterium]